MKAHDIEGLRNETRLCAARATLTPPDSQHENGTVAYALEQADNWRVANHKPPFSNVAKDIIRIGADDVAKMITPELIKLGPDFEPDAALEFVASPETITRIGEVASLPVAVMNDDVIDGRRGTIFAKDGGTDEALERLATIFGRRGCPYAQKENKLDVSPIFSRFAVWAGQVAVHQYAAHRGVAS